MGCGAIPRTVDRPSPIDREAEELLAETLADDPLTFGIRCILRRHIGSAWVRGPPEAPRAALVVDRWQTSEPSVLGTDPEEVWPLLREVPGWTCVNCTSELARALAPVIERELRLPTRLLAAVYYTLDVPPRSHSLPSVRRLTEDDLALVERAPEELFPIGFDSALAALSGGIVAGAVVDDRLVARTSMTVSSEGYADIGSYTLPGWRDRGFASAALSLVAAEVQHRGLTPVWSTGEENLASQRVARKVGFREFGRKSYVVISALQETGGFRPAST